MHISNPFLWIIIILGEDLLKECLDLLDEYLQSNALMKEKIQNQIYENYVLSSPELCKTMAVAILNYNDHRRVTAGRAINNEAALTVLFNNISDKLHAPDKTLNRDTEERLFNTFKDIGENLNTVKHSKADTLSVMKENLQFIELWGNLSYKGMKQVESYFSQARERQQNESQKTKISSFWSFICKLFSGYYFYHAKKEGVSQEDAEKFANQIKQDINMMRNCLSQEAKDAAYAWAMEEREQEAQEIENPGTGRG